MFWPIPGVQLGWLSPKCRSDIGLQLCRTVEGTLAQGLLCLIQAPLGKRVVRRVRHIGTELYRLRMASDVAVPRFTARDPRTPSLSPRQPLDHRHLMHKTAG